MESTKTTGGASQRETGQSSRPIDEIDAIGCMRSGASALANNGEREQTDALDLLAQALLQEEVLERDQVFAIVNGAQSIPGGAR